MQPTVAPVIPEASSLDEKEENSEQGTEELIQTMQAMIDKFSLQELIDKFSRENTTQDAEWDRETEVLRVQVAKNEEKFKTTDKSLRSLKKKMPFCNHRNWKHQLQ